MKTIIDTAVVLLYLGGVVIVTLRVARKQKNKEDFIMAGRSMHWFPLALSGVAASFSAISLLGCPGFVMAEDMRYLPTLFMGIASIPIVYYLVVPFLYKLKLVSIYSYLGKRFCPAIRYAASVLFMISKLGYLAMSIFTPSLALAAVTGLPVELFICVLGALTTIYTLCGGMQAVIWTDVIQYFVIVAGIAGAVIYFMFFSGGTVGEYWQIAEVAGKTKTFDWSLDFSSLSVWVIFLNCTLLGIANTCANQDAVQRLCTAKSIKDSMKGYLYSIVFGIPIVLVLYFIGVWMFGFFHSQALLPAEFANKPDQVFPYLIVEYIPAGVAGLLLAGILAAGMSTISAVLHSLTSVFMVDVYEKLAKSTDQNSRYVLCSRIVTGVWGVLAVFGAFYVMYLGNTIVEVTATLTALTGASLGGVFMLGIFSKRTNSPGILIGCIFGLLATIGSWYINKVGIYKINFMWYGVFGLVTACVVGYIASLFFPAPSCEKFENIEK
ncbi:MAG: sodium/solute symporter [Lentisphaeria bacterium]|nr:sodium/solute symporter [Lentisphaeria bacterium]